MIEIYMGEHKDTAEAGASNPLPWIKAVITPIGRFWQWECVFYRFDAGQWILQYRSGVFYAFTFWGIVRKANEGLSSLYMGLTNFSDDGDIPASL